MPTNEPDPQNRDKERKQWAGALFVVLVVIVVIYAASNTGGVILLPR